ncbi:probable helicase senataxin isoform X2 [Octodon degus]|uniref:Probable helicase senataxin isoform X2 n=1 Tax=Octodon degus TaxID=10160 RepID=A0A6P6D7F1_OCTDE|nr:probable helicase senataxin isoform X2 [Octodon degus]
MSTCCWCTPGGVATADFLKCYASKSKSREFQTADEDLCYCLECVAEYHRARDELPFLHEVLWELETSRLINHFEKSMKGEVEDGGDDDELYIVDNNGEAQLLDFSGQDFENKLRVPLLEILKYPYLLLHERVNELCVEALCRMEQANCSFQVFEKHPGIYLFLVHPNEMIRRWAILTARNLGKVDRDDYYDLQEVLTCLFNVIELGLLESPDIYTSSVFEKGKLILLPTHMYDTTNYKNYWLGICMLLTILEEQAMDSLLLGSDKQNDFMQLILHTMGRQSDDDNVNPFWPALHCFMVILDRLGSKVWGQLIDPIEAFQTIINNRSYNREIQNIRNSSIRTKLESEPSLDDMVTCSQIVYNYNPEKTKKDLGWRSAICPDYCPNMYEEMETLASVLQSDIGQDMRVHNSTFLWFIPFVQSLMDLKDLGVAYIAEVIHHLYSQVKDVLNQTDAVCDKVTEFFLLILVSVIELHRNKKCLHLLWVSSQQWVAAVVKCAKLPTSAFVRSSEKSAGSGSKGSAAITSLSMLSMPSNSVQLACVQLIRSLLKEGYQLGQQSLCKRFWDKLNLFLRGNLSLGWQLTSQETHELQNCLKQIIKNLTLKVPQASTLVDLVSTYKAPPASFKEEGEQVKFKKDIHFLENSSSTFSKEPVKTETYHTPEHILIKASSPGEERGSEHKCVRDLNVEDCLSAESWLKQSSKSHLTERAKGQTKVSKVKQVSVKENSSSTAQICASQNGPGGDRGIILSTHSLTDSGTDSLEQVSTSSVDFSLNDEAFGKSSKPKTKEEKDEICAKLSHVIKKQQGKSTVVGNSFGLEENLMVCSVESFCSEKDKHVQERGRASHSWPLDLHSVVDDKNEQKPKSSLLLKKKQLKNEELDIFSSHGNSCEVQECRDDKDLVSVPEATDTLVKKTSPSKEPVTIVDSREKVMSKRTALISSDLQQEPPGISPKSDPLPDSQVDRDLHKLSLIAQASVIKFPTDTTPDSFQPQKKVKANESCVSVHDVVDSYCGQVIVISDSDDEDERPLHFKENTEKDRTCLKKVSLEQHDSTVNIDADRELVKEETAAFLFEDSDSQVFEFESQSQVFSVWQDQKVDNKNSVQEREKSSCVTHIADSTDSWGCGAGYISEEVQQAEDAEGPVEAHSSVSLKVSCEVDLKSPKRKRVKNPRTDSPPRPSSSARNKNWSNILHEREFTENDLKSSEISTTTPPSRIQRATAVPGKKSPTKACPSKPARRVPVSKTPKKTHADGKKGQSRSSHVLSCRTAPAVVPPKKSRQCPEPTSVAEKLGLKKAPRRAFELSQRSLDYTAQLRNHGKTVGVVDTSKKTVRNNKKLLVSQDLHLQRQLKQKPHKKRKESHGCEGSNATRAGTCRTQNSDVVVPEFDRLDCNSTGPRVLSSSTEKEAVKFMPSEPEALKECVSQVTDNTCFLNQRDSRVLNGRKPTDEILTLSATEDPLGRGDPAGHQGAMATRKEAGPESNSDIDDDNLFLTQHDPEDMDLCSQVGEGDELIEVLYGEDRAQVEGPVSWPQVAQSGAQCKHKGCVETRKNQGEFCSRHSEAKADDEDVFRKPGLPPSLRRPSTTKIFSSSSRTAHLSKSLESSVLSSALKNKSKGLQSALEVPQPVSQASQKPVGEAYGLCTVPQPRGQPYKLPLGDKFFSASLPVHSSQSISDTFIKEILKWKYDMFLNFDQCGPPASLCQSISRPVPVRFQDYREYFHVFLPLIILNTFETVAQEWMSSPNKENFYQLHLRKFSADYKKTWEFVVYLKECELAKQLHPKENDLVFLVPERLNGGKSDRDRRSTQELSEYHCGYVHRFRRTSVMCNGKSECSLSIQTEDNFPANLNEVMKCIVISSLVTTQRKLKAMSLLSGRNQLARAILNPNPMDFCTKDLLTTTSERLIAYLKDYNEEQKKAIETAYAMVKHPPSVAKICLIHGPPGTGKSKTIVGLLFRLLTENQRGGHSDENSNAKIKQNRVLVCAPSNAAVDELMKKIIIEFKEKCKDKKNPLGNCGDINLVRLGPEKSINNEVLKFSLDSQVNHRMKKDLPSHVQEMHRRKEFLDHQLDELSRQRALCRGERESQRPEFDEQIAKVSKERQELASKIKEVQGRPQKTQSIIILESHIICCTLSTSGGLLLESAFRGQGGVPFSCVIVDEAGQSCEVETLTPLIHRCNKLILVGDPKQLPPTVISMKAQDYGYDQSMMARFCKLLEEKVEQNAVGRLPVVQLVIQYRMHPDICLFPSNYIYCRNLKTHKFTESLRCSSDWPFQPYLVFDVSDGSERRDNEPAEVDTVDAFQGRQKDCIIVTCVRANTTQGSIGFLASLQRLNVTITRAKYSLFILGHLRTLMENQHWNELIQDAQKRGAIVKTCDKNYRHDAMKILKLKPALQRSLTHPPTITPEVSRPLGGLPSSRLDSGLTKMPFAASLYHSPSDSNEAVVPVTARDPEGPLLQDRLRDPRLLRRFKAEAKAGTFLRDPQALSPQHPGAAPPWGELGFSVTYQDLGSALQPSAAHVTPQTYHCPLARGELFAVGTDTAGSRRRGDDQESGRGDRREAWALSEGEWENYSFATYQSKRESAWNSRSEDNSSKKRKLW